MTLALRRIVALTACSAAPLLALGYFYTRPASVIEAGAYTTIITAATYMAAAQLLKNQWTKIAENQGIPVLTFGSGGVINQYIAKPKNPEELTFTLHGKKITIPISRQAAFYLRPPQDANYTTTQDKIIIEIPKKDAEKNIFTIFGKTGFVFNEQMGTIITKDFVTDREKDLYLEHNALYITRKIEEISKNIKENADYAIALLGRKKLDLPDWAKLILVGLGLAVIIYFAWPIITSAISGASSGAAKVAETTTSAITSI